MKKLILLFMAVCFGCTVLQSQTVNNVNPLLFLEDNVNVTVTTVNCTLSDGTSTFCYEIVSTSMPTDHAMGPWCPDNISDSAADGGIWIENGQVYDVDGAFIQNMANFYNDNTWLMYDGNGDIYVTDTQTDCANAANPNVGTAYENYCVECLPSYVTGLTQTYCIPVTPVQVNTSIQFSGGGPGGGGPGGPGGGGPSVRGIAFNGVRFDGPAPTNVILQAYTLAPFDDAGGHINLNAGYHYHAATGQSTEIPQADGHAPMIGYALDGHGIYAELDASGNQPSGLDQCRGHYDATRGYHYHVDAAGANNFIDCLYGAYATNCGTTVSIDADGDGFTLDQDCDDNNAAINPAAIEIANNTIDENCDGLLTASACASVGLNLNFDNFPGQTSWAIIDANNTIVASGNNYGNQAGYSTLTEASCLEDGCYTLEMYDALGNGLCPFQSSAVGVSTFITPGTLISPGSIVGTLSLVATPGLCGSYELTDAVGTTLASGGGAFGASQSNNFCLSGGVAPRIANQNKSLFGFSIFPKIAAQNITVVYQSEAKPIQVNLIDINGYLIQQFNPNATQNLQIDVSNLSAGINFVQLVFDSRVVTEKFIKQ